jgi:cysteinyl-tRNA synthetase
MHNGYININNEKMSKSLGNFLLVRDIAKEYDLEAVRLFLLGAQYRNPVNFSRELVEQADTALSRIRTARERLDDAMKKPAEAPTAEDAAFLACVPEFRARWEEAMDDDLNTADALGTLFDFTRAVNSFVSEPRGKEALEAADAFMKDVCHVMGLLQHRREEEFPREALALLEQRGAARAAKDWARADAIRGELKALGFAVEDGKDGAKLKRI